MFNHVHSRCGKNPSYAICGPTWKWINRKVVWTYSPTWAHGSPSTVTAAELKLPRDPSHSRWWAFLHFLALGNPNPGIHNVDKTTAMQSLATSLNFMLEQSLHCGRKQWTAFKIWIRLSFYLDTIEESLIKGWNNKMFAASVIVARLYS